MMWTEYAGVTARHEDATFEYGELSSGRDRHWIREIRRLTRRQRTTLISQVHNHRISIPSLFGLSIRLCRARQRSRRRSRTASPMVIDNNGLALMITTRVRIVVMLLVAADVLHRSCDKLLHIQLVRCVHGGVGVRGTFGGRSALAGGRGL